MTTTFDHSTVSRLRMLLLELARREEETARTESATTPYWAPVPLSALGHRTAAVALRAQADQLLVAG